MAITTAKSATFAGRAHTCGVCREPTRWVSEKPSKVWISFTLSTDTDNSSPCRQVYFKQFCRTCKKSFNPYRVEDITCQVGPPHEIPNGWDGFILCCRILHRYPYLSWHAYGPFFSRSVTSPDAHAQRHRVTWTPNVRIVRISAGGARARGCPATARSASSTSFSRPLERRLPCTGLSLTGQRHLLCTALFCFCNDDWFSSFCFVEC